MKDVTYSTIRRTFKDLLLLQRIQQANDYEALLELVLRRTDLSENEAMELDDDDMVAVIEGISKGMQSGETLAALGKRMEG